MIFRIQTVTEGDLRPNDMNLQRYCPSRQPDIKFWLTAGGLSLAYPRF
jgi:hypothetical protein